MKMGKSNAVFTLTSWLTLAVRLLIGTTKARADRKVFAPVLVPPFKGLKLGAGVGFEPTTFRL